jgi:CubicO group peptidase (beta-lactamase class C family)
MFSRRAPLVFIATLLLGSCATPPPAAETIPQGDYSHTVQYLNWLIDREMSKNDITGLSIALVDNQKIIWQKGFGYADLENQTPATPETIYRAGSIAKVFTAAAAMQLAEQGKLDIDQPLTAALPEFSIRSRFENPAPITPRNIMFHHSGLPSNYLRGLYVREPARFDSVVDAIRDEYLAFPPNYVFSYSNLGMALLGAAIQEVSQQSFDDYMAQHLFKPLGMAHSSFEQKPITKAYDRHQEIEVFSLRDMPAANLLSNVVDLGQFLKMQFADGRSGEQRILTPASLREMVRIQNKGFPLAFGQYVGLGWMMSGIDIPGGGPVASHGGSLPDSHSLMAMLPEHKLGVAVLTNSSTSHIAVSLISTEALRLMLAAKTGISRPAETLATVAERPPSPEELRQFDGYFDSMVGLAKITTASGQIDVDAAGHQFRLVPHEDGLLTIKYKVLGMLPVRVGAFENIRLSMASVDGHQIIVGRIGNESLIFGEKLNPGKIPASFLKALGDYEVASKIDGPSPDWLRLKEDKGILVGEAYFPEVPDLLLRIAFRPVSENEVVTAGLGTSRGDTLRLIKAGDETLLGFSGIKLRKKMN